MMKPYLQAALVFALIGAIVAMIFLSTLPASAHRSCVWFWNRDGRTITINRGPCYYHDLPQSCKVPPVIISGQRIDCRKGK